MLRYIRLLLLLVVVVVVVVVVWRRGAVLRHQGLEQQLVQR
jgi:hypothetical protein